ncbi:retention module-containing protein, partial [Chitinimonas sp. PSY-7]|uniref:retention module-containing protein n=1 Tax=Chitinimonas sp. PSY-7 TaxID=3459088 RepID=UPI00403FEF30
MAVDQVSVQARGVVVQLEGHAWAIDRDGNRRQLKIGDSVQEGEQVITAAGAQLELGLPSNQTLLVSAERTLLIDASLLGQAPVDASEAALAELNAGVDTVIQALNEGRDLSLDMDPTSAGLAGGENSDAHGFIRLLRLSEHTSQRQLTQPNRAAVSADSLESLAADAPATANTGELKANDDVATVSKGGNVTINVMGNDSSTGGAMAIMGRPSAANGTVLVNADGTLLYTPTPQFVGSDTIRYTITDNQGHTSTAAVSITVMSSNANPVTTNGQHTTTEDQLVSGSVTATDVDGDTLTYSKGNDPAHGIVTVKSDGTWIYTPAKDYNGTDSFTVTVSDGNGGVTTSTITIDVTPANDVPVTTNYQHTTEEDKPVSGSVTATEVDGDTLTYSKGSDPAHGTVTVKSDGTWTYTPTNDYNGTDSFTVTVSDGNGGVTASTITIDVTPANDAPVTANYQHTTEEDKPVSGKVTATDVDGDRLTYSTGIGPTHGTVTVKSDGTWTYTPTNDYNGTDSFTVTVSDGNGGVTTSTITIDVTPANDVPVATNYQHTTEEDKPVSGSVTATDVDGDTLSYSKGSDPAHGTVTVKPDGTWTYTPAKDYNGTDSFTVTVSDGNGGVTTSAITIDVTPVDDLPVISAGSGRVVENTQPSATGNLSATDVDNPGLAFVPAAHSGQYGSLSIDATGKWTYTLDNRAELLKEGEVRDESFTVTLNDG